LVSLDEFKKTNLFAWHPLSILQKKIILLKSGNKHIYFNRIENKKQANKKFLKFSCNN